MLVMAAAGCGSGEPTLATVTGKVYLDDVPVPGGAIVFIAPDGSSANGVIKADGSYEVLKAPLGKVKAAVQPPLEVEKTPQVKDGPAPAKEPLDPALKAKIEKRAEARRKIFGAIPDSYQDPARTRLSFELVEGPNTVDVHLSRKGK